MSYARNDLRKNEMQNVLLIVRNVCAKFVIALDKAIEKRVMHKESAEEIQREYYLNRSASHVFQQHTISRLAGLKEAR